MNLIAVPVFSSLTLTTEPTPTASVETLVGVDDLRGAQAILELRDALLEHRLLVLGVVVLGVLGDVTELARFLDALGDLAALGVRQLSSSSLSFWSPSGVRMTSLGMSGSEPRVVAQGKPRAQAGTAAQCSNGRTSLRTARAAANESVACSGAPAAPSAPEALDVPGVGLAHPARRRARDRSARRRGSIIQSSSARISSTDGFSVRPLSSSSNSHGLPSDPRASITAAAPVRSCAARTLSRSRRPPVRITGAGSDCHQPRREVVVRHALVVDRRAARVKADRRDAGLLDEPVRERVAVGLPRPLAAAQLHGHRQAAALDRSACDRDGGVGILDSAAPAPVLQTFGTGQPMLRSMIAAPRWATVSAALRMTSGSCPKSWIEDRALVGVDPQQLVHRLLVAMVDREARHHLADRQPRAVARACRRTNQLPIPASGASSDAVWDLDGPDPERRVQHAHQGSRGPTCCARAAGAGR